MTRRGSCSFPSSLPHFLTSSLTGLTFVELLMAATMFSILAIGFSAHLHGGVTAWRRATSTLERLQIMRVACDQLAQDLANAIVFDATGTWHPKAAFGAEDMQLYTLQRASRAPAGVGRVAFVRYDIVSDADAGTALTRSVESAQEAAADAPARPQTVLTGVASWRLRYGYVNEAQVRPPGEAILWRDEWNNDASAIPRLVEVTIELTDAVAGGSSIRRVVLIPQGRLGTMEQP